MTTIKDVAEAAQVSITTVSHVVNGTRFVSEDLRLRVLAAMQRLGYRPNGLARSLRRGHTGTIALILPDNANMFFAEIAREIEDLGFQNGYSVILCNTNNDNEKEIAYTTTLLEKQVDGLIFISAGGSQESLALLQASGTPLVIADRELAGVKADLIQIDNFNGGYLAGEYLVRLGHRRLGCISGPERLTPSAQRVEGFLKALADAHIPFEPYSLVSGDFSYPSGEQSMQQLLALGPRRPSAVFVCNDMMAIGALRAATIHGLQIPASLSIIGFDGISLANAVSPALTTIAQPIHEMAQNAVNLLLEQIKARAMLPTLNGSHKGIVLAPRLIERESCAPWP